MMLLIAVMVGLGIGGAGYLVAPEETRPSVRKTLLAGTLGALPGVLVALMVLDDYFFSIDPSSLAVSILGATLTVMAIAFLGEGRSTTVRES